MDDRRDAPFGRLDATSAPLVESYGHELASHVALICAAAQSVSEIFGACVQLLPQLVQAAGAKRASIMLINPETGGLTMASSVGLPVDLKGQELPYRPRSISEWVVQNQRPAIIHGEIKEERFEGCDRSIESALSLPLQGADGPVGVLNLARAGESPQFHDAEMLALARLCYPLGVAVERVHRTRMAERCLKQLQAPAGEWVSTSLLEGSTDVRNFQFGLARVACAREAGDMCVRIPHVNGGQTLMALDSSATGVESAVISAFTHGMLVASAAPERSAVALVARLNASLHQRLAPGRHLALWIGQLSGSGELSYCNAGMAPPLWVPSDDNPPRALDVGGPVAGVQLRANYHEEVLRLLPGDLVVGASNGVLYARDGAGNGIGVERLIELVVELRREPLDRLTRAVCEAARSFGRRALPSDDLMVFALRYTPGD